MKAGRMVIAGWLVALATASAAQAVGAGNTQVETTPRHRIVLEIGPPMVMLTPHEALKAGRGDLMLSLNVRLDEGAPPVMAVADEGQPVNHQVDVRIYDRATGDVILEPVPRITIRNETTGAVRRLAPVVAMQNLRLEPRDYHFGNNVYLPDGRYTVTVVLGDETAVFRHLALKAIETTT